MKIVHRQEPWMLTYLTDAKGFTEVDGHSAPHECSVPDCPGNRNRLKLELFDEMLAALERANVLAKLVTVRQAIESGDEAIEASGLNPWCMNEGLADGYEKIGFYAVDLLLEKAKALK